MKGVINIKKLSIMTSLLYIITSTAIYGVPVTGSTVKEDQQIVEINVLAINKYPMISKKILENKHMPFAQVLMDNLEAKSTKNIESDIVFTLKKGMVVNILSRESEWLEIKHGENIGFIDITTVEQYQETPPHKLYIEPKVEFEEIVYAPHYNPYNLRELSNLSEEQIYNMLEGSALQTLSRAYYYAEKEYNINAIFLMALNSEESGHGKSQLSHTHNNIGGIREGQAWKYFSDWGESLNYIANLLNKYYLDESGSYYNGVSIWDVNVRYCEGTQWSYNINSIADNLISKIN